MVTWLMATSAFLAAIFGFAAVLPFPLVIALAAVYSLFVSADSSAITTGAVQAAPEHEGPACPVPQTAQQHGHHQLNA